jgi:hypothetical protein
MSYGRYRRLSQNPGVDFTTRILSANHISHTYRPHTVFLARAIHQPIESSYLSQFYTHLYLRITIAFTVAPARHRRVSRNPLAKYIYIPPTSLLQVSFSNLFSIFADHSRPSCTDDRRICSALHSTLHLPPDTTVSRPARYTPPTSCDRSNELSENNTRTSVSR